MTHHHPPTSSPASVQASSFLATFLRAGLAFGAGMALFFGVTRGARIGLTMGPVAGLLFGSIAAVFVKIQSWRLMVRGDVLDGERIVYQGGANHWSGAEARGGWLVLTERALVFRAHGLNAQNQPVRIALAAVRAVAPTNTLGIVRNGLRVEQEGGKLDRFVVNQRAEWIRRIEACR
jgi:hypothetical protein